MKLFRKLIDYLKNTFTVHKKQIIYTTESGEFIILRANEFTKLKKYKDRNAITNL